MEEKYELLASVLKALQAEGVLDGLVICYDPQQYNSPAAGTGGLYSA